jgi:hypothetical protein
MDFGKVLTVNVGAAGGIVGINASVAMTYFDGTAKAGIRGTGSIRNVTNSILVKTTGTTKAFTATGAMAAGVAALNAGVAKAVNRTTVRSEVERSVTIDAPDADMTVAHDFRNEAKAVVVSVAAGLIAAGASVAIVINKLDAESHVGKYSGSGSITAKSLTVTGNADGGASVTNVGVSAGGVVAVNASVSLAMNYASNVAKVALMPITLSGDLKIKATLTGDTDIDSTAITAGLIAVGASVNVAKINSRNEALLELGADVKARSVSLDAGTADKPANSQATVLGITGTAGGVAVNVNVGLAYNAAQNRAKLSGYGNLILTGDGSALSVRANGRGRTYTALYSAALGGVAVNVSVALAQLRSVQEATVSLNGNITADSASNMEVISTQNTSNGGISGHTFSNTSGDSKSVSFGDTMSKAYLFTAGLGLASVSASSVTARAESTNRALLEANNIRGGAVSVASGGSSTARAQTEQVSLGIIAIGVIVGHAIAGGSFEAGMNVRGGTADIASLDIQNNYRSEAVCDITPSAGGVDLALYNGKTNVAIASNTTRVYTGMTGGGTLNVSGAVNVNTLGGSYATAVIHTPVVTLSAINTVVNVTAANNRTTQLTEIRDMTVNAQSMTVRSDLNDGELLKPGASALVGGMADSGVSLNLVGGEANVALANFRATNYATLQNFAGTIGGELQVIVNANSIAKADVEVASNVSLFSVALTVVKAYADGRFSSSLSAANRKVRAGSVKVNTNYEASAWAESAVATKGVSVALMNTGVNVALAEASPFAEAVLTGEGGEVESDDDGEIAIAVNGKGVAHSTIKEPLVSISGINVAISVALAQLTGAQNAWLNYVNVKGGSVHVSSVFNESLDGVIAADATIGAGGQSSHGFSLAGLDIQANTVTAKANTIASASLYGAAFDLSGTLSVVSRGKSVAHAGIRKTGSSIALVGVGVMVSKAYASGTFNALVSECRGIKASSLSVLTDYTALATAETTQPTGGIKLALLDINTNISKAEVGTESYAGVAGSGSMNILGNAEILAKGTISAAAEAMQAGVSITAVDVTVNEVESHLCATQQAHLNLTGEESSVGGALIVDSTISGGSSNAVTEGSAGGVDLHLVGVDVNKAEAHSTTNNTAAVIGGTYTVGSLKVRAIAAPSVRAEASSGNLSLGLVTVGSLSAKAFSQDTVRTTLDGAKITSLNGGADISAEASADSYARSEKGGQLAVVSVTIAKAEASVGTDTDKRESVRVTVRGGMLKARDDILITARNAGHAEAVVQKGWTVSAIGVDVTKLPTMSYYDTAVSILDDAQLISDEGSVDILSSDKPVARSVAKGTNIGFLVDAEKTRGENTLYTNNYLTVQAFISVRGAADPGHVQCHHDRPDRGERRRILQRQAALRRKHAGPQRACDRVGRQRAARRLRRHHRRRRGGRE